MLTHSYFEDYVKRQKEIEATIASSSGGGDPHKLLREKTKVSEFCTIL